jgi:hypothetical protein
MNNTGTKKKQHYEINGVLKRKTESLQFACLKYSVLTFVEKKIK